MKMFFDASASTFKNAKQLRKNLTETEGILWSHLSKKKMKNLRFRRQHPIASFIVDFYCHKAKLVIEVDGPWHLNEDQIYSDNKRTSELNSLGVKVIRFSNDQIRYRIKEVLDEIRKHLPLGT